MMKANKISINADDFGYSHTVNSAIICSFQRSLVTHTSLMANMPGFDDAVRLYAEHAWLTGKTGLHINLTEGSPLTDPIRECGLFCNEDGYFQYDRSFPLLRLSAREKMAVFGEIKAQLERLLAAGIRPSHLDSHHHVHTEWAIAALVIRLGKQHDIRRIRLTRNMGRPVGYTKRLYKKVFNHLYLKYYSRVAATDYFGDVNDMHFLMHTRPPSGRSIEVMVHPLLNEWGELEEDEMQTLRKIL